MIICREGGEGRGGRETEREVRGEAVGKQRGR